VFSEAVLCSVTDLQYLITIAKMFNKEENVGINLRIMSAFHKMLIRISEVRVNYKF
jgi:hypothetical protein